MRLLPLLLLPLLAAAAPSASAADPTLEALLKAADLPYEIDEDGDYAIVIEWSQEKRSQLVYVSGTVQDLDDTRLYSVFSPAKVLEDGEDELDPALARRLLAENARYKFGSWELAGKNLYFSGKIPAGTAAGQFHTLLSVIAGTADDLELELSPDEDAY